jgi:hypothetical protein
MKKDRESRTNRHAERVAKLDDYELKPHYDVEYSKAKPNRFAGRVKLSHGGPRANAGRKRAPEPIERHTITLYRSHAKYLRGLDKNLSQAIRKLISKAR